jgi:hypothetical protein
MKTLTNRLAMRRLITSLAAAILALASVADAQTDAYGDPVPVVATSLAQLQPLLKAGTAIRITDAAGARILRKIPIDPILLPDQPLRAWWSDDPARNGILNGLVIGAAGGAFFVGRACAGAVEGGDSLLGCTAMGSALVAGGGALVGLLVDTLIHRKELHVDYRPARRP